METSFLLLLIVAVVATMTFFFRQLLSRIEFLEHEVRWLRNELEQLKPVQLRSEFDKQNR